MFLAVLLLSATFPATAAHVFDTLLRGDWNGFRKLAASSVSVEEYWTAYDDYFSNKTDAGKGVLGRYERSYIGGSWTLSNEAKPAKEQRAVFAAFCKQVKESRTYSGLAWQWPFISTSLERFDCLDVVGPIAWGKVASNENVVAGFTWQGGKWLVNRLMVIGH